MATDTREDAGQYYPGGDVIPTRPMPSGGGGTIVLDDTVTQSSSNGVKSSGIWTWCVNRFAALVHTHTKSQITDFPTSMTPTAHAASHGTNGSDAITPAAIGADVAGAAATAKAEAIAACEPSGAATAAVTAHNSANDAHSTLFSGKVNKSGDTMTGNLEITNQDGYPKVIVGSTQYRHEGIFTESSWLAFPSDVSDTIAVAGDIPDVSGKANISDFSLPPGGGSPSAQYVSSLFSSEDTSTDPQPSGLLKNSALDIGIVKVTNSIVGVPNATLEAALGTAAS